MELRALGGEEHVARPPAFADSLFRILPRGAVKTILFYACCTAPYCHKRIKRTLDGNDEYYWCNGDCTVDDLRFDDFHPASSPKRGKGTIEDSDHCSSVVMGHIAIGNVCSVFRRLIRDFNPSFRCDWNMVIFHEMKDGNGELWVSSTSNRTQRSKQGIRLEMMTHKIEKASRLRATYTKVRTELARKMREIRAFRREFLAREGTFKKVFVFPFVPLSEAQLARLKEELRYYGS